MLPTKPEKVQDYKTALAIQKEINKLLGLYPRAGTASPEAGNRAAADFDAALAELAAVR